MKSILLQVQAQFQWQGMLDSYISYICLARAIKLFAMYGEAQVGNQLAQPPS